ncbi:MAG: DoxX protein [Bacteroidetes bacterium]|jgi:uncharacterized membrane protein YphA (DoxX/SURF4 family)|nr:DoxX protein [Bacteroidota bacterium]
MNSTFTRLLRVILGLVLLTFGLYKVLPFKFIPPPDFSQQASEFLSTLTASGYILFVLGLFEIFIGLLLLLRKWVPFALVLFAPISLNIFMFHLFLDNNGLLMASLIVLMNATLMYKYWRHYKILFY